MEQKLIKRKELAQKLGVSVYTILRWEQKEGLPRAVNLGTMHPRYNYEEVLAWMTRKDIK